MACQNDDSLMLHDDRISIFKMVTTFCVFVYIGTSLNQQMFSNKLYARLYMPLPPQSLSGFKSDLP